MGKDSTMAITTTTDRTMAITTTTDHTMAITTTTTTTTTTLLASKNIAVTGAGSFEVPIGVVGALGFLAGGLSMSIVFVVMGYIRSRQSMVMQRTLPSSNSIVSMASARELGQQQA